MSAAACKAQLVLHGRAGTGARQRTHALFLTGRQLEDLPPPSQVPSDFRCVTAMLAICRQQHYSLQTGRGSVYAPVLGLFE